MKIAVHQPQYWPWPRYVHKVLSADVFVYLDTAQFSKNGVQNRNQVLCPSGPSWITLPVIQQLGQRILDTRIADPRAAGKHLKTIAQSYARTEGWRRWRTEIEALLSTGEHSLSALAIATTEWMLGKLGATSRRVRASELGVPPGPASAHVAALCREAGGSIYLTGSGALEYLDPADFAAVGCEVRVQTWAGLEYPQVRAGFAPDLSTLDLLLVHPDDASDRIRAAGGWRGMGAGA